MTHKEFQYVEDWKTSYTTSPTMNLSETSLWVKLMPFVDKMVSLAGSMATIWLTYYYRLLLWRGAGQVNRLNRNKNKDKVSISHHCSNRTAMSSL